MSLLRCYGSPSDSAEGTECAEHIPREAECVGCHYYWDCHGFPHHRGHRRIAVFLLFCHQRCHKPSYRNCRPLHRGFRLATSISNSASITTIIVVSLFVTEASASAPASVPAFRYRSNETCYTMLWTPEQLLLALSPSAAPAKVISVAVFTLIEAGSILRHRGKLALYSLCGFD